MIRNGFEEYYLRQAGTGLSVFAGNRSQVGHGLGNILGGLARMVVPILRKGGKSILTESVRGGMDILGDLTRGQNIQSSLKRRAKQTGSRLMNNAAQTLLNPSPPGEPKRKHIKTKKSSKNPQSTNKRKRRRTSTQFDIFD